MKSSFNQYAKRNNEKIDAQIEKIEKISLESTKCLEHFSDSKSKFCELNILVDKNKKDIHNL